MKDYDHLLIDNKTWAKKKLEENPDFFKNLVNVQNPKYLWIGCSDSRVPPNQITQTLPGEIFIHRNIANLVVHTDLNLLSVLQFAIEELEVEHIIVCGHYGCGGVKAAITNRDMGIINKWLRNIKDVYRYHEKELDALQVIEERVDRLVELNIIEQVDNLIKTSIIQKSWKKRNFPYLHGWVYNLSDGIIRTLVEVKPNDMLDHDIYAYNLD